MKLYLNKLAIAKYTQVLIVFLAFLAMVLVSYFYVSQIVRQQIRTIGEETMDASQMSLSIGLHEAELLFTNVVYNVNERLADGQDNHEIYEYLKNMYDYYGAQRLLPDFMKIYAYIRDEFLDGSDWIPPEDYYPPLRPWYINASASEDEIQFSNPYIDLETGGVSISISRQLFDNDGNSYGVVAVIVKLTRIIDYIMDQEVANSGYGVLLDEGMRFTAHRDHSLLGVELEHAGGEYDALARLLSEQRSVSAERFTDVDGTDSIAFFRPVFIGWHIGVIIPRASFYGQVYNMGIVLGGLGFVLMLLLSYMLVRLHAAQMRSEEESRSKSSFLARISHEMRTPMNAIIGMVSLARKAENTDEMNKCIDKIDDSANHLLGIINDVLDMSKIAAGKMELANSDFRFQEVLDQVEGAVRLKMDEKHQDFTIRVDEYVPKSIVADKRLLAQVMLNLLSNANKFTPEGGKIGLTVHKLEDADNQCTLQFEVEDDGIGIPEGQKERLFRPFEQADNSISRKYGGTGLGLTISHNIINMMNGRIWVESKLGEGSKFIFTIDVGVGEADEVESRDTYIPDANDIEGIFSGKHILLVDDVEINREILIALLEDTGVSIDCAENGREAYEKFAGHPELYDLIFMDIHMPEMDGYEATKMIREMNVDEARTVPIIAMTADVFSEDIEKCLQAGMNDHVGKPLDMDTVILKMKRLILS